MKIKQLSLWMGAAFLGLSSLSVQATPVLYDYGFNIDNTDYIYPLDGDSDSRLDLSSFDDSFGLGTITTTITGTGSHTFDAFFDHEIDESINSFFNETGFATGTIQDDADGEQSWEIDEPGFGTQDGLGSGASGTNGTEYIGDISSNFGFSTLNNDIFHDDIDDQNLITPDDVSLAMGWDFELDIGEEAIITLLLSDTDNGGSFFLTHSDPDSQYEFYLSSTISIISVPEPSILFLFGTGLAGLVLNRRRIFKK